MTIPRALSSLILLALWSCAMLFAPSQATAKNPDLSLWETNLSAAEEPADAVYTDYASEIAVVGDTVHVMWLTDLADGAKAVNYRRSLDSGTTWEPVVRVATFPSTQGLLTDTTYKRMAVMDGVVYIFHAYYGQGDTWYGILGVSRSLDNGQSFQPVEVLESAGGAHHIYDLHATASQGTASVGYRNQTNWNNDVTGRVRSTSNGGASWTVTDAFSFASQGLGWRLWDCLRLGDALYLVYSGSYYYYGLQESQIHVAASANNGESFTRTDISVIAASGKAKTYGLQDNNYVPKLAAHGTNLAVIWSGEDADGDLTVFLRTSANGGITFSEAAAVSRDGATKIGVSAGQETLALQGTHLYVIYQEPNQQLHFRLGSPLGITGADTTLTTPSGTYYGDFAWWASVAVSPADATGATAAVVSDWPQVVTTTNAGATFNKPVLASPRFSYGGTLVSGAVRPHFAFDDQGRVHYVVEARYYSTAICSGYCDFDIFHRRMDPPATPTPERCLLRLLNEASGTVYNNMQVPAGSGNTVTTALTMETWVRSQGGDGRTTGDTLVQRPLLFKRGSDYRFAYALQSYNTNSGRVYAGRLLTADGEYWVTPTVPTDGLEIVGEWQHLAMTYNAAAAGDNLKLYVNGRLVGSTRATGAVQQGQGHFMAGYYGNWDLDDVRIWGLARSAAQIAAAYNARLTGTEAGLLSWYPFDGRSTRDMTGHGNDGTLMYAEQFLPGGPPVPMTTAPFEVLLLQ